MRLTLCNEQLKTFASDTIFAAKKGGDRLARQYKNARKSQKLIVKDAAAKLDVSPSTLGAWESERKAPSIESLEAMADLYQVSTDYLLGREETTPTPSLPLPGEVLKIYHGKSVWSSDYGWVLVNSIKSVLICVDGSMISFENAGSVYAAQPPFYEASLPNSKPLSKQELQNCQEVWLEPISHDTELREQLRGTYKVYEHWAENNFGNRFSLDTYGVKWLAFSIK